MIVSVELHLKFIRRTKELASNLWLVWSVGCEKHFAYHIWDINRWFLRRHLMHLSEFIWLLMEIISLQIEVDLSIDHKCSGDCLQPLRGNELISAQHCSSRGSHKSRRT